MKNTKLVKRMEAYRESARTACTGNSVTYWTAFAAAAGSALAMASSASAAIIYTKPASPVTASIPGLAPSPTATSSGDAASFEVAGTLGPDRFVIQVTQQEGVSSTILGHVGIFGADGGLPNQVFSGNPGKTFFVPLSFSGDNGWVRLEYFDGSYGPIEIEAIDWAYNNAPGGPITPGQTTGSGGSTPEPSTAAMILLAAGSAGVLAWRRQRAAKS